MADANALAYSAFMMCSPDPGEERLLLAHVRSMVVEAVKEVSVRAFKGEWGADGLVRLQKDTEKTLVDDGLTPALGKITLDDDLIIDSLRSGKQGRILHEEFVRPLVWCNHLTDLYYPHVSDELGYFTIAGGNSSGGILYAARFDGTALTGEVKIKACHYQTIDDLAPEFHDEVVQVLAEFGRTKLRMMRAEEAQQMGG